MGDMGSMGAGMPPGMMGGGGMGMGGAGSMDFEAMSASFTTS